MLYNQAVYQMELHSGFKWILIQDYFPQHYINPSSVHAIIPEDCQNSHSILRWWQPVGTEAETIKKSPMWLIDNIAIEYSREELTEIYDNFRYVSTISTKEIIKDIKTLQY